MYYIDIILVGGLLIQGLLTFTDIAKKYIGSSFALLIVNKYKCMHFDLFLLYSIIFYYILLFYL